MTTPIRSALSITRMSLYAALSALVPSFGPVPAAYWQRAAQGVDQAILNGTLAGCLVYQPQDGGGRADLTVGARGWQGLITIKAYAAALNAAEALLASIPEPLVLTAAGYSITARYERPLDLPALDDIHVAASIYRITIHHM